jgi:Tfp pilus assembly protein PilO
MEEKSKKTKDVKKDKRFRRFSPSDFIIPGLSGLIFILVLFFILIPSVNNSNDMLSEIKDIRKKQETLSRNLNTVKSLDFVDLQKNLSNARSILPQKLEVAQFAYYIDDLAEQKGLTFRELKAGDVSISTEEVSVLDVKGIRVPMAYSGEYDPMLDFFNELQVASPYVLSFGHKVTLNKSGTEDEEMWSLEIDVTGYYVEEDRDIVKKINSLTPFVTYYSDQQMVTEFMQRAEKLSN